MNNTLGKILLIKTGLQNMVTLRPKSSIKQLIMVELRFPYESRMEEAHTKFTKERNI